MVFLHGCREVNSISEIDSYVKLIDVQTDLEENTVEFDEQAFQNEEQRIQSINSLSDKEGSIKKIQAVITLPGQETNYLEFYYNQDSLKYASFIAVTHTLLDTIINSEYYFNSSSLIGQNDWEEESIDPQLIIQSSQFYIAYMNQLKE